MGSGNGHREPLPAFLWAPFLSGYRLHPQLDSGLATAAQESHPDTTMSERRGTFSSPFSWELGKLSYKYPQKTFPFYPALGPCPPLNQPLEGEGVSMICLEQSEDHN